MHHLLFIFVCLIWGTSFILMKKAAVLFGPISIGLIRVAGGGAVLVALWWLLKKRNGDAPHPPFTRRDLPAMLVPVTVGMVYPYTLQPYLIGTYQDSAFFGMLVSLVPILTIAISLPMLGIRPHWREAVGVLGGLGFILLLFEVGRSRDLPWSALMLAPTIPLGYAISNTFIKRRLADRDPLQMTWMLLAMTTVVLLPISMATETVNTEASTSEAWLALGAALFLGIVGTGLATAVFYHLVQQRGPLFAGMVTYIVSPIAVVWGGADGEPVTATQVVALVGILTMVALVQWPTRQNPAEPAQPAPPDLNTCPTPPAPINRATGNADS